MIKMIFPDKFVAALGKHTYPIQIERDAQGWRYRADLGVERIGYRADAVDGKLPTQIDDPAVYNWDRDGHPGATLILAVPLLPDGELYVVQRGQSILNGRVVTPGRIDGGIEVRSFDIESSAPSQVSSTVLRKSNPTPREVASPLARSPREQLANRCARPTPILGKNKQEDSQRNRNLAWSFGF